MKRFAILATILAAVTAAPSAASAGPGGCTETTDWNTGPYSIGWHLKDDLRTVVFDGFVGGWFAGECRGLASGKVVVTVRRRDGEKHRKSVRLSRLAGNSNREPLEFKSGYLDSGKRFNFRARKRFMRLRADDCFTAKLKVRTWRFQDNQPVPDSAATIGGGYSCN